MTECVFCKIIAGELPSSVVYQDDLYFVFLDIQPVNPGHLLLIPKRHIQYVSQLDEQEAMGYYPLAIKLVNALRKSNEIKLEGVNLFLADGEAAFQEVFHTHLHIIPRYVGDGFGIKFPDHYKTPPNRSELEKLSKSFRNLIK